MRVGAHNPLPPPPPSNNPGSAPAVTGYMWVLIIGSMLHSSPLFFSSSKVALRGFYVTDVREENSQE